MSNVLEIWSEWLSQKDKQHRQQRIIEVCLISSTLSNLNVFFSTKWK